MKTGWLQTRDGSWYYFMSSGKMKIGWCFIDNKWCYFNTSGQMKTGWLQLGKDWYYFDSDGVMVTNRKVGKYYLGPDGKMQ